MLYASNEGLELRPWSIRSGGRRVDIRVSSPRSLLMGSTNLPCVGGLLSRWCSPRLGGLRVNAVRLSEYPRLVERMKQQATRLDGCHSI